MTYNQFKTLPNIAPSKLRYMKKFSKGRATPPPLHHSPRAASPANEGSAPGADYSRYATANPDTEDEQTDYSY